MTKPSSIICGSSQSNPVNVDRPTTAHTYSASSSYPYSWSRSSSSSVALASAPSSGCLVVADPEAVAVGSYRRGRGATDWGGEFAARR